MPQPHIIHTYIHVYLQNSYNEKKDRSHKPALTKLCLRWRMTHTDLCLCGCRFMLCGYLLLYLAAVMPWCRRTLAFMDTPRPGTPNESL